MGIRNQHNRFSAVMTNLIFILFFLSIFLAPNFCYAISALPVGIDKAFETGANAPLNAVAVQGAGYGTTATFETIVATVITTVLGLLGAIFLILAIYGGYGWMTAGGNEDKVSQAKKIITNAVIGLVVVLAAYAIARLVVEIIGAKVFK